MNGDKWMTKWDRQSECPIDEFKERNEGYPLDIPMLIQVPETASREAKDYFDSVIVWSKS